MRKALFGTLNKKASGVSGLGPVQLKAMKQNDDCEIPHAGVQRADRPPRGDARRIPPIAIGETVTNIFHRVLPKRLVRHANYLSCEQIAFKQNAYAVGVRRAHELISRRGCTPSPST